MMRADGVGLYVHIPFCVRKCNYCDFCSYSGLPSDVRGEYIKALTEEIKSYKREPKIRIDTVFFGGGTPTLLTRGELSLIWNSVEKSFDTSHLGEFTFEANPGTVTPEILSAFRDIGANRISIGMQSIHENELKKLGRIHTHEEFLASYSLAREYFSNASVDVMYGIPEQTKESFLQTLETVIALAPEHISVYGLIIEEGTLFFQKKDSLPLPSEDEECDMYDLAAKRLALGGYSHYEISNYAKSGYTCRHNLIYWRDGEYIGVGVAAASYFGNLRYTNTRDIAEYLKAPRENYGREYEKPDELTEYIMLALRTSFGASLAHLTEKFGEVAARRLLDGAKKFEGLGYTEISGDTVRLTERGFYISNYLISELI